MNFELGGITVPILSCLEFSQTYELVGGSVMHRMQSGRAVKQTHFTKLKTVLSGQGWVPAGLDGLNFNEPLLLKCAAPRTISSCISKIVLPAERRSDAGFEPKGFALICGQLIEIPINIKANIAMLDAVPEAVCFQIQYYPELSIFAELSYIQGNTVRGDFSWAMICEEI